MPVFYNPFNSIFKWLCPPAKHSKMKIGDIAGTKDSEGYIKISLRGTPYYAYILAWFYYYGYMPEKHIDHRNRKRHCNWILNLREASYQCNRRNTGNNKNNTSGVKGVYFNKKYKSWYAAIKINTFKFLGLQESFDETVCARLAAEQCVNWAGCDSNSPAFKYVKENIQRGY